MTARPAAAEFAPNAPGQARSWAGVWQADRLTPSTHGSLPTGHPVLDAELPGGGWPLGAITEVLQAQAGWLEWRLLRPGLGAALGHLPLRRNRGQHDPVAGKPLLLLGPPHWPHLPAFTAQGIDPGQLLLIRAQQPAEQLWAVEQALHCKALGLLLCWLPQVRAEQLRRLQLAARACDYPVLLFRPLAARHESSPAPLRLTLTARGSLQLQVGIVKRRGPALEQPLLLDAPAVGLTQLLAWRERRHPEGPSPPITRPASDWALPHVLDRAASQAAACPASSSLA